MIALLLLACALQPRDDAAAAALAPHLARLDHDGDGRVSAVEYTPIAADGPPFSQVDRDGDGGLTARELEDMFLTLEPSDPNAHEPRPPPAPGPSRSSPEDNNPSAFEARARFDLLRFLEAEVAARDPSFVPTPDARLRAIAGDGDLGRPRPQAHLAALAEAWTALGLEFPAGLLSPSPSPAVRP